MNITSIDDINNIPIEYFKIIAENSLDWECWFDPQGNLVWMNSAVENITGFSPNECCDMPVFPFPIIFKEDSEELYKSFQDELNGISTKNSEFRIRCKDGTTKWLIVSWLQIKDHHGRLLFIHSNFRDISERKESEEKLKQSENKFRLIFENAPLAYQSLNQDGFILDVNPAWLKTLEYEYNEVIGHWFGDFLAPNFVEHFRKNFPRFKAAGQINGVEFEMLTKSGKMIFVNFNGKVGYDIWGNFKQTHCVFADYTAKHNQEIILRENENKLKQTVTEKDKFFSILAHDLRSPLASFIGLTETISKDFNNLTLSEIQEISLAMFHSSQNLYKLLENLLEWSQIKGGMSECRPTKIDLFALSELIITSHTINAYQKNINLINEIHKNIFVNADSKMLESILRNLISNALKFTNSGGTVKLGVEPTDKNMMAIVVSDTGIGIKESDIEKIFKIEVQYSHQGTMGEKGSGLGLILCKEMIEKMGGDINIKSKIGEGTIIRFTLPLYN